MLLGHYDAAFAAKRCAASGFWIDRHRDMLAA
jgi:hypothetical protein